MGGGFGRYQSTQWAEGKGRTIVNTILQGSLLNLRTLVTKLADQEIQTNTIIQLSSVFRPSSSNNKIEFINRSIVIPVDIPQLQVIHTVEINILSEINSKSLSTPYAPQMVAVGQAIPAELVIYHSRAWNSMEAKAEDVEVGDEELDFFYEVQNHLDVWLVSGRKRAHFTAKVRS